ncbi:hypothetical protein [Micromonospora chersina]
MSSTSGGMLYPLLSRLHRVGWVTAYWLSRLAIGQAVAFDHAPLP